jgi:hypothetical protein
MAQQPITDYPIDPVVTSGTQLADVLNRTNQVLNSGNSGTSRPPMVTTGGLWVKTGGATPELYMFDGTNDIRIAASSQLDGFVAKSGDTMTGALVVEDTLTVIEDIKSSNPTTGKSLSLEGGFAIVHRYPNNNACSAVTFDANNIQFFGEYAASTVSCDILGNGSGHRYAGVGSTTGGNNLSNIMAMGWAGSSVQFRVDATVLPVGTLSDSRVKTNINPATGFLEKVLQLNPVFYSYSASQAKSISPIVLDSADHLGFIAQEVGLVIPEAVTQADPEDADSLRGLDAIPLISALVAAMKEQQALITQLQSDVAALKAAS